MSTVTLTLDATTSAVVKGSIHNRDYHFDEAKSSFNVQPATTAALMATLSGAYDTLSNCFICGVGLGEAYYKAAGQDPATQGNFSEVSDYVPMEFTSISECRAKAVLNVFGPIKTIFTGSEERVVDIVNADVLAFAAAAIAVLKDPKYGGITDWAFIGGERQRSSKFPRGVR